MATRGQGSFVSRTKSIDRLVKNETITRLLKHVGGTANAIYEATGSQGEALSTHFMVASQSNVEQLNSFEDKKSLDDFDKAAEDLRLATRYLGIIVGKIDVEESLGSIFSDFCIGK